LKQRTTRSVLLTLSDIFQLSTTSGVEVVCVFTFRNVNRCWH